jgi:hypothetical protein
MPLTARSVQQSLHSYSSFFCFVLEIDVTYTAHLLVLTGVKSEHVYNLIHESGHSTYIKCVHF